MHALRKSGSLFQRRRLALQGLSLGFASGLCSFDRVLARTSEEMRTVSVGGGITEIICALGYESCLVGVDTTSRYPASVHRLPSVGYARNLSLEGILSLTPDRVIVGKDAGPVSVLSRLAATGVSVSFMDNDQSIDGLILNIKKVGELLNCPDRAEALSKRISLESIAVAETVYSFQRILRVIFVLGQTPSQFMVAGTNTGANTMLRFAGLHNAFSHFNGYRPVTAEGVIAAQPDLVVFAHSDSLGLEGIRSNASFVVLMNALSATPAALPVRWLVFDTMYLLGFGPRMPDAILTLHRAAIQAMQT